jgi:NADH-quinone oxidoreductase subunit H
MMLGSLLVLAQIGGSAPSQGELGTTAFVLTTLVKMVAVVVGTLSLVAILTLAERKIAAWIQDRYGPNRAGPGGLLQPAADGLKNFTKETAEPEAAYKPIFRLAPVLAFVPALLTLSVIPLASPLPTPWGVVPMQVADLPIGFLYILAITSLGVYGITLAGWSSNNKYALLGGLRSSAQLVSYEIAMGLSTIPILLLAGNVAFGDIIAQQAAGGFSWNVVLLSVAFFTFVVAAFAETNRLPFDLPEAESELIAGYHTEYSGMKFAMFFLAEYANMITASALIATLFLGGWDVPFTTWDNVAPWSVWKTLATFAMFAAKTGFFLFVYIWVRWTVPRFRYDQLMSLGWKFMLPLTLAYVVIIATVTLLLDVLGVARGSLPYTLALLALNIVLLGLVFVLLDRGRLISPASARARESEVQRLRALARARVARARGGRSGALASDVAGD